jgi:hypothetical protein
MTPPGLAERVASALSEADPNPPRALELVGYVEVIGRLVLGTRVWRQRTDASQVLRSITQHPPERHEVAVEVIDSLKERRRFGEQYGERSGERLNVMPVLR